MNLGMLLIILLLVMALGGLPNWGYHSRGYAPSGVLGTVLVVVLILVLLGRFPSF